MSLFDLLFIALALSTLVALAVAAALAIGRRSGQSLRILRRLAFGALVYFAVVIAVSFFAPRRVLKLGEEQCFDDWCVAAESFSSRASSYLVDLRISSRARRISQRELNLAVYLTDRANHRYNPTSQPSDIPFSTVLAPGESVHLTRHFPVPAYARDLNLVIQHEGGFPIGWFIIGYDTWFRKPPLVLLTSSLSP
jgi:hypothetical protein